MKAYSRIISGKIIVLFALVLIFGCQKDSVAAKDMMLFDFEDDSELDRFAWKCRGRFELSSDYKNTGSRSLRFEFHPSSKVGFSTGDVPQDWSIYRSFDFWVYNPSQAPVPIYVRVNRRGPSGNFIHLISRNLKIGPGKNLISIPLQNEEDLANNLGPLRRVGGFFLYMQDIQAMTVLYFDSFKMTRGAVKFKAS
jgi:hypothetical protein